MGQVRCGLPTQAEIDSWDAGQRARGHEMVRLRARIETVRAELERADPDDWDWIRELIAAWDSLEDQVVALQKPQMLRCAVCGRHRRVPGEGRYINGAWTDDRLSNQFGQWVCCYMCYDSTFRAEEENHGE